MSLIQTYFKRNAKVHADFIQCPVMRCTDGFSISVQASKYHYCSPREMLESLNYTAFECGFPNRREILLKPFAEDWSQPTKTVYGYVPVEVLDEIIVKHGGLKS